jgi:hypothetical protein
MFIVYEHYSIGRETMRIRVGWVLRFIVTIRQYIKGS